MLTHNIKIEAPDSTSTRNHVNVSIDKRLTLEKFWVAIVDISVFWSVYARYMVVHKYRFVTNPPVWIAA